MLRRQRACRLICLSLFFVVTSGEEEGKFLSVCADFSALFTLPPPHPPPHLCRSGSQEGLKKRFYRVWVFFVLSDSKKLGWRGHLSKSFLETQTVGSRTLFSSIFKLVPREQG